MNCNRGKKTTTHCKASLKCCKASLPLISYNTLNEEKLKIEYDLNSKIETTNVTLSETRMDLDNLSQDFQQKLAQNKSLFKELKDLEAELEGRRLAHDELDEALNRERNRSRKLGAEKEVAEDQVRELSNEKLRNEEKIDKLFEDNQKLQEGCAELENRVDALENEKIKLISKIDEQSLDLKNLTNKLRASEDDLRNTVVERDHGNKNNSRLAAANKELEVQLDEAKKHINDLKITISREQRERQEAQKLNDNYEGELQNKEKENKRLFSDLELLRDRNDKLVEDNTSLLNEGDRLRGHIIVMSDQNSKLENELNAFVEQDERVRAILARKDRVHHLLSQNRNQLDKSIHNLEETYTKHRNNTSPYSKNRYDA